MGCCEPPADLFFLQFKIEDMSIFRFRSINTRLSVYMLFPVAVLLIAMGYAGFIYARNRLFEQWREAVILELQQEAHKVDMRLSRP